MSQQGKLKPSRITQLDEKLQRYFASKKHLISLNKAHGFDYSCFLPKQLLAIEKALEGNVIICLPTGYGKSFIYQILAYALDTRVIVCSPLSAILIEQADKLGHSCIHVTKQMNIDLQAVLDGDKTEEPDAVQKLKAGNFKFIIGQ